MNEVNKTLYITLYGKSLVSKKGIILKDQKAEEIWDKVQFKLKGKSKSKQLAYYMAMRSRVFDEWVAQMREKYPDRVVLHIGCGLDSRIVRVGQTKQPWYDIDFDAVIVERKCYYNENGNYRMLSADARDTQFVNFLPNADGAIVLLEGLSMYMANAEMISMLSALREKYKHLNVLVDCYTSFAVKMSKLKNPVQEVGVSKVYGVESPQVLCDAGIDFKSEKEITPANLVNELKGFEKLIFKTLYAGNVSKKLYKLYEYEI